MSSVSTSFRGSGDAASIVRRGLLGLVAIAVVGLGAELAFLRHWEEPSQLIAWASLAVTAVAWLLVVRGGSAGTLRIARILALAVLVASVIGVAIHVNVNIEEATEPENWGDAWLALSPVQQLWEAFTGGTGDIPSLAPASLAQTALALLLATVGRPTTR